jgi:hypothetical protein
MSDFLKEWVEKRRAEFYSHVRPWISIGAAACAATGRRITPVEMAELYVSWGGGANSYERRLIVPLLNDEALADLADYCIAQGGGVLGELDIATHYNDAVEREFAPLLSKRLRESAGLLTAAGQQKRGDRLETELNGAAVLAAAPRPEAEDLRRRLQIAETKLGADAAELDHARREAAAWEVQCQDLRDRVIQADSTIAMLRAEMKHLVPTPGLCGHCDNFHDGSCP